MSLPRTCTCGRRVMPGTRCVCGSRVGMPQPESERPAYRKHYGSAEYQRNRKQRYHLAQGRCEACKAPLKGELFPDGVDWQCDHTLPIRLGGTNSVSNLVVLCIPHHKMKHQLDRRKK